jgi:hypothetical protein
MTRPSSPPTPLALAKSVFVSPALTRALATTSVGTAVFAFSLRQLVGWPGVTAIISALVVLTTLSLASQWREIGWSGLLPISLLAFVGWAGVSIFWSQYHWATLGGLAYLFAFTVLGIYVALAQTSTYGHFGRELPDFTWEKLDRVDALRSAAKL